VDTPEHWPGFDHGGIRKANLHNAKAHSASRVHARQRLPPERSGEVQGRFGAIIGSLF